MKVDTVVVHTLHPGDVAVVGRGERLETVLGSCVAIVLSDPRRTVGAMCHVVHASPANTRSENPTAHGDAALARMFQLLRHRGIEPRLCQAWVYGGGHMFPGRIGLTPADGHVGATNAHWALHTLHTLGLHVVDAELGGHAWRRLGWTVGPDDPELRVMPLEPTGAPA